MKKISIFVIALAALATYLFSAHSAEAITRIRGYVRKSTGTYVMSHYRSDKNYTKYDNWSYHGNTNPFTGKRGYKY